MWIANGADCMQYLIAVLQMDEMPHGTGETSIRAPRQAAHVRTKTVLKLLIQPKRDLPH